MLIIGCWIVWRIEMVFYPALASFGNIPICYYRMTATRTLIQESDSRTLIQDSNSGHHPNAYSVVLHTSSSGNLPARQRVAQLWLPLRASQWVDLFCRWRPSFWRRVCCRRVSAIRSATDCRWPARRTAVVAKSEKHSGTFRTRARQAHESRKSVRKSTRLQFSIANATLWVAHSCVSLVAVSLIAVSLITASSIVCAF